MRKEKRPKTIMVDVFIADDGKEFEKKEDCRIHERMINGEIIVCPTCNGKGRVDKWEEWVNYHTYETERMLVHPYCDKCHGKGYLEQKIT